MKKFNELFETEGTYPMNSSKVLQKLRGMTKEKNVYFAYVEDGGDKYFDHPVDTFDSWRGSYNYPTCYSEGSIPYTVEDLIEVMGNFFGSVQTGYKGGEYVMYEDDPLWADSYGSSACLGVKDVVECEEGVFFIVKQCEY